MAIKKNIFVIIGSASENSANQKLIDQFAYLTKDFFSLTVYNDLKSLPHFDPESSIHNPPSSITQFRTSVTQSDGVIICTPEYVFSIPSGLKNILEWSVATTIFSGKPTGLITASAQGEKGHIELQLIMKTVMAKYTDETCLLIQGIKGMINTEGKITDNSTLSALMKFIDSYKLLVGVADQ